MQALPMARKPARFGAIRWCCYRGRGAVASQTHTAEIARRGAGKTARCGRRLDKQRRGGWSAGGGGGVFGMERPAAGAERMTRQSPGQSLHTCARPPDDFAPATRELHAVTRAEHRSLFAWCLGWLRGRVCAALLRSGGEFRNFWMGLNVDCDFY